jgi:replicative superfamily II helicase
LSGAFDLYTAFLLDGIKKTNENGVFCWIIPNKLLVAQYAAPVLEHLKQNGLRQSISISDTGAFTKVGVYPIIITGNKSSMASKTEKPDFYRIQADSLSDLSKLHFTKDQTKDV